MRREKRIWKRVLAGALGILTLATPFVSVLAEDAEAQGNGNQWSVSLAAMEHGFVELDNENGMYQAGDLVTVSVYPDDGYVLENLNIQGSENLDAETFKVTNENNEMIAFPMPGEEIELEATFAEAGDGADRTAGNGVYAGNERSDVSLSGDGASFFSARAITGEVGVGQQFSGTCHIGNAVMEGVQSYFDVGSFSGSLAQMTATERFHCADPTAAEPKHVNATYLATVTAVNETEGYADLAVRITPPDVTDGVTTINGLLAGYQHVAGTARVEVEVKGDFELQKTSADTNLTEGSSSYSLSGAVYGVYDAAGNEVTRITTDANGYAKSGMIKVGSYTVKEITPPLGYHKDDTAYPLNIAVNQTAKIDVSDKPGNDLLMIRLNKIDKETKKSPIGSATLEGAQFTIRYYNGYCTKESLPEQATRTWVIETKKVTTKVTKKESKRVSAAEDITDAEYVCELNDAYKIAGDDFYHEAGSEAPTLPFGTITIEETKAPKGYVLDGACFQTAEGELIQMPYVSQITMQNEVAGIQGGNVYNVCNQVARGDFAITKIDDKTQAVMAGIPFTITSDTTGETHTFTTDENGHFSSAADFVKHSVNTNGGKAGDGLWFGQGPDGVMTEVSDQLGALPYDTYTIKELKCEANKGKDLYQGTLTIRRNGYLVRMGNIENADTPIKELPEVKSPKASGRVKTGDHENLVIWMILSILAAGSGITVLIRRKNQL